METQLIKESFCKEGVAVKYDTYKEKIIIAAELIKAGVSSFGRLTEDSFGYLCSHREGDKWTFNDKESIHDSIAVFNTVEGLIKQSHPGYLFLEYFDLLVTPKKLIILSDIQNTSIDWDNFIEIVEKEVKDLTFSEWIDLYGLRLPLSEGNLGFLHGLGKEYSFRDGFCEVKHFMAIPLEFTNYSDLLLEWENTEEAKEGALLYVDGEPVFFKNKDGYICHNKCYFSPEDIQLIIKKHKDIINDETRGTN